MQNQQQTPSSNSPTRKQQFQAAFRDAISIKTAMFAAASILLAASILYVTGAGNYPSDSSEPATTAEQADTSDGTSEPAATAADSTPTTVPAKQQTADTADENDNSGADSADSTDSTVNDGACAAALTAVDDSIGQLAETLHTDPSAALETLATVDSNYQQATEDCGQDRIDEHRTNLQKRSELCETAVAPIDAAIQQAAAGIDAASQQAHGIVDAYRTGGPDQQAAAAHDAGHLIETVQAAWAVVEAATGNSPGQHASRLLGQCNSRETAVHTYITGLRIIDLQTQAQQVIVTAAEIGQPHQH